MEKICVKEICNGIKANGKQCTFKAKFGEKCGFHRTIKNANDKNNDNETHTICIALKGNGEQCMNKAKINGKCGIHQNERIFDLNMPRTIFTIGHSNRDISLFLKMLKCFNIEHLVDVRSFPGSRKNPQFGQTNLKQSVENIGIKYTLLRDLGGFRKVVPDSINTGWKNTSFQGYADYMSTNDFIKGLTSLQLLAETQKVAYMCSEAVPWQCHRSMISDALTVLKWNVLNIMSCTLLAPHKLTLFLKNDNGKLTYPPITL